MRAASAAKLLALVTTGPAVATEEVCRAGAGAQAVSPTPGSRTARTATVNRAASGPVERRAVARTSCRFSWLRRREELQSDAPRIAERQAGTGIRVHDPAVLDSESVEALLPYLQLVAIRAGTVIATWPIVGKSGIARPPSPVPTPIARSPSHVVQLPRRLPG